MPVLLYHRIADLPREEDPHGLAVSPQAFGRQMETLHGRGYRFLPLTEMAEGTGKHGKTVSVTFDDGYLDCYSHALPVLESYGIPATVFLVTDFVGESSAWEPGRPSIPLLDRSMAREMAARGVSFQSHTRTHPDLRRLSDDDVARELTGSREAIREMTGTAPDHLAYPYGRFDERVKRLAGDAGYRWGWAAGMADGDAFSGERMQIAAGDGRLRFFAKTGRWSGALRKILHR